MRKLAATRLAKYLTREEVATGSGVHVDTIRGIETGRITRPRMRTMRSLAGFLRVEVREIEEFQRALRFQTSA